ncbi:unnamed protein product [Clonostachys solani]|uniref:CHAT domain-containing protein n=1 Tax=Clonostachys solani TaxID=160281 RepID=A0A9N9YXJ6_9HYPO|nr:unnamed protein product [Clonostachys solani]
MQDLLDLKLYKRAPFLAYLSACNTGYISSEGLPDEGLHLISSCQVAGFRHVIGTLRMVNDEICYHVAKMTYNWIKKEKLTDDSVSEGLHHAIRSLRDEWVLNDDETRAEQRIREATYGKKEDVSQDRDMVPLGGGSISWAPFVHFGI